MRRTSLAVVLAVLFIPAASVLACWAYTPIEHRLLDADMVVVGKIVSVKDGPRVGKRAHALGRIAISEVLKGDKAVKEVGLLWPAPPKTVRKVGPGGKPVLQIASAMSTDIRFKQGQDGVWLLRRDKKHDAYWATYPGDCQPKAKRAEVAGKLERLTNLPWGEAVNGLQVAAVTIPAKGPTRGTIAPKGKTTSGLLLQVYLRNASAKPLYVNTHMGSMPVRAEAAAANGGKTELALFPRMKPTPARKPAFMALKPGQIIPMFRYADGQPVPALPTAGAHQLTVTYRNREDGKQHKLGNVWTGEIAAKPVTAANAQ